MHVHEYDIRCSHAEFAGYVDDSLSNVFDKKNHSGAKRGNIPIVALQGSHGGVMAAGDRSQGFTAFDLVARQRRVAGCP